MLTLRRATIADVVAIHTMTQAAYQNYRQLLPHSSLWQETPEAVAEELAQGPIVLAQIGKQLVGSVRCHAELESEWNPFMYVHRLAVLPEYRRQGIGRILMQAVEDITHEAGLAWVRLEVRAAQPENQAFYLKLGYELGAVSRYLPDGCPRSHWMSKRLL